MYRVELVAVRQLHPVRAMSGRLLMALGLLGGCDVVFGLSDPPTDAGVSDPRDGGGGGDGTLDGGPPLTCFLDGFDADPLSPSWDVYADASCTSSPGIAPCGVSQASGQLAISGNTLEGYAGAARSPVDFTDATVEVEAVPMGSLQPYTNSYLQIALDATRQHWYQIEVDAETGAPVLTGVHVDGGARAEAFAIALDPQQHRLWQLAQVREDGLPVITFSTRASVMEPWTRRGSAPVTGSLSSVIAEVGAGRYMASMTSGSQTYAFDNFSLCTVSP